MKLTAQEEYGLRCLVQVARHAAGNGDAPVPIRDVAKSEGLSVDYAAKLLRVLRLGGLIVAERGAQGGFRLARPADAITLAEILGVLDTPLYGGGDFCQAHSGRLDACVHTSSCSLRVVWRAVEGAMAQVLGRVRLADLLLEESQVASTILHQPAEDA